MTTPEHIWTDAPDFRDPAVMKDPYPHYQKMFQRGKPFYVEEEQAWYVFAHRHVNQVLKDRSVSVNRFSAYLKRMPPEKQSILGPFFENLGRWMTFIDDDAHKNLRFPVQKAFDSKMVRSWESWLENTTARLVGAAVETGETIELMSALASPLPLMLICEILGMPEKDGFEIKKNYLDIVAFFDNSTDPAVAGRALHSDKILNDYMHQRIELARSSTLSNLMTFLVQLEDQDADLSDPDIAANAILLLGAGHETTTSNLLTATQLMFSRPEWLETAKNDSKFRMGLVDEALRLESPLQRTSRITREPIQLDDLTIPAGQRICLLFGAAGRDPDVFESPSTVNPHRGKNPHFAFSAGAHYCIGARIAKMETSIALKHLAQKCGHYSLVNEPLNWAENMTFRSLTQLRIRPNR